MKGNTDPRDRAGVVSDLASPDEDVRWLAVERAGVLPSDEALPMLASSRKGEEVLNVLHRGAQFARDLLGENERLRASLAQAEDQMRTAAQNPTDWEKLRHEMLERTRSLEDENRGFRERLFEVEDENRGFADRYLEIEEENNNLANLYVASYQLHSTLDLEEVLRIVVEIVINLVGAETFAVYALSGDSDDLNVVAAEGAPSAAFPKARLGVGPIGEGATVAEAACLNTEPSADLSQPMVVIPLHIQKQPIGVIAIFSLLQQKEGFTALDHELFNLLGGHAATSLFAARLYSESERKLNTIQGFLDLLVQ